MCLQQLGELQANYNKIKSLNAELIALSADPQEMARQTVRELNLMFPVLSDSYRTRIRAYDVLHPQEGIARPSVFIVDKEGKIRWQYISMSAADRPSMMTIFDQLEALQ